MTTTADIFAEAMTGLTDSLGTAATYTPDGGEAVDIAANVEIEVEPAPDGFSGGAWSQITTVEALLDDFGQEPDAGDAITVGATTYTVTRVIENDGTFVKVAVK